MRNMSSGKGPEGSRQSSVDSSFATGWRNDAFGRLDDIRIKKGTIGRHGG